MTSQQFIASLQAESEKKNCDFRPLYKQIESWHHEGNAHALLETARYGAQAANQWKFSWLFKHIVSAVALGRGAQNLDLLFQILDFLPQDEKEITQMITQNHELPELLTLFENREKWAQDREFLAVLTQLFVLRKHDVRSTIAEQFWNSEIVQNHDLKSLPLTLLPAEKKLARWLPMYGAGGMSWSGGDAVSASITKGEAVEAERIEEDVSRIRAVVQSWEDESNGSSEAAIFRLHRVLDVHHFGTQTLRSLPMESLRDADEEIALEHCHFEGALSELFNAACHGGAYSSGEGGAYARLKSWRALGALCGCGSDDIAFIAQNAENSAWFRFRAHGDWFICYVGVLCLRADGKTLAVLCATDND